MVDEQSNCKVLVHTSNYYKLGMISSLWVLYRVGQGQGQGQRLFARRFHLSVLLAHAASLDKDAITK